MSKKQVVNSIKADVQEVLALKQKYPEVDIKNCYKQKPVSVWGNNFKDTNGYKAQVKIFSIFKKWRNANKRQEFFALLSGNKISEVDIDTVKSAPKVQELSNQELLVKVFKSCKSVSEWNGLIDIIGETLKEMPFGNGN